MVLATANHTVTTRRVRPHAEAKLSLVQAMGLMSVRQFMQRYDLSHAEVARMLQVSKRSIENWSKDGTPKDRQRTLGLLAQHFENAHQARSLVEHVMAFLKIYQGQAFASINVQGRNRVVSAYEYGIKKRGS